MRELLQDYLFRLGIDVPPIPAEPPSPHILSDYVRLEREALESPAAPEFWRHTLAGSGATSLESDVAHEAPATVDPMVKVLIPRWLQAGARQLAISRGVPMKSVLLAAHCVTLQRLSGETDVTTGLITHGRPGLAGAEVAAGLFLNTIPIRLDKKQTICVDVVEHIARLERTSHRYRRYPLQAMQSDAGRPLFNTAFNFVNYHLFADLARATGVELLDFEVSERTNFALLATAGIDPRTGRLFLRVNGDPLAVTATQAREYANVFMRVLAAIVRAPERALDPRSDELTARDVTQPIAEQAATTPDAVALVADAATQEPRAAYAGRGDASRRVRLGTRRGLVAAVQFLHHWRGLDSCPRRAQ